MIEFISLVGWLSIFPVVYLLARRIPLYLAIPMIPILMVIFAGQNIFHLTLSPL